MPNKIIKDYFSFTKKERVGVIVLVFIIIIVFIIPYLLPEKKESINKADWEQFKAQSAKLVRSERNLKTFSEPSEESHARSSASNNGQQKDIAFEKYSTIKSELFYFDPNTLAEKGWEKLGLRSKTISTIQNYLSKGGRFRHSEDLGKIYGLHKNELERLIPFVKINIPASKIKKRFQDENLPHGYSNKHHSDAAAILDINTADTSLLIALPGIGSKLAARIIHFREKLGAFYSVNQLSDVYGLPDSTFQKLRSRLTVSTQTLRIININSADVSELKQLPYLSWNVAKAIVEFRGRHGPFKNLDELLQIEIFTKALLEKTASYLTLE